MPRMLELLYDDPIEMVTSRGPSLLATVVQEVETAEKRKEAKKKSGMASMFESKSFADIATIVATAFVKLLDFWRADNICTRGELHDLMSLHDHSSCKAEIYLVDLPIWRDRRNAVPLMIM